MARFCLRLLGLLLLCAAVSAQTVSTVAGGGTGDGKAATLAFLNLPFGVAVDASGNVFIADQNAHRIRKVDTTGFISTFAGTGIPGFAEGGPGQAMFNSPALIRFDAAGNLYVADFVNNRIRKIDPSGNVTTLAGTGAQGDNNGPAGSAQFRTPSGVAVDSVGNVYVADSNNHKIKKVSQGTVSTVAGSGTAGFAGDGGSATQAQLNFPMGIAFDSAGNLYVADSSNSRIRKIDASGSISTFAGGGTSSAGSGVPATQVKLYGPQDVIVGSDGNVYFSDVTGGLSVVYRVTPDGSSLTRFAGASGGIGYLDGVLATSSALYNPAGLAMDSAGRLYIADSGNHVVRVVGTNRVIGTFAGGAVLDGAAATDAGLASPSGVSVDALGNVLVADTNNHRIRRIDGAGIITTVAGSGLYGFGGDGEPATTASLYVPSAAIADSNGNIYIADSGNSRVRKVSAADGTITTLADNNSVINPAALAFDADGNLLVVDRGNRRVRKVTLSTGSITTVAGNGGTSLCSGGTSLSCGDGGPAVNASFADPRDIAVDSLGIIYVADAPLSSGGVLYPGARIRKVDRGGTISTVAGNGQVDAGGDNGLATAAGIGSPAGLAIDRQGTMFIADERNHRIRKAVLGGTITTLAGGDAGFSGDGGAPGSALFRRPRGLAIDSAGSLLVVDSSNQRLRKITQVAATAPRRLVIVSGNGQSAAVETGLAQPLVVVLTDAGNPTAGVTVTFAASSSSALELNPAQATTDASGQASTTITFKAQPGDFTITATAAGADPVTFSVHALPLAYTGGAVNSASYSPGAPVSPGAIVSLFGKGMAIGVIQASSMPLPGHLGSTVVKITAGSQTLNAPLFYVSPTQLNFMMPFEIGSASTVSLVVSYGVNDSQPITVSLAPSAPGIFSMTQTGAGQGAIQIANTAILVAPVGSFPGMEARPANRGEYLTIYCAGLGEVSDPPPLGTPAASSPLSITTVLPTVTIGGQTATPIFSGLAPGFVGLYQINVQVPDSVAAGDAVTVVVTQGGVSSNAVTIAVQKLP